MQIIKTNGYHVPTAVQIKTTIKQQFPNLNVNKIKIRDNISATNDKIISNDYKFYNGSVMINYILDKSIANQINLNQQYIPNQILMQQRHYNGLWINNKQITAN